MTNPLLVIPSGGRTVDDLDALPGSHHRYESTDGWLSRSLCRSGSDGGRRTRSAYTVGHGDCYQVARQTF